MKYTWNCKLLTKKKWKEKKIHRKILHAFGLEEFILLKCSYYPKWYAGSMQSLSKFQGCFFHRNGKTFSKFIWILKRHQVTKVNLKKNKVADISLPGFKLYYETIVVKI